MNTTLSFNPDDVKQLLTVEKRELNEKIVTLDSFIRTEPFAQLADEQQHLLKAQLEIMTAYASILRSRLSLIYSPTTPYAGISNLRIESITVSEAILRFDIDPVIDCAVEIDAGNGFFGLSNTGVYASHNYRIHKQIALLPSTNYTLRVTPIGKGPAVIEFTTLPAKENVDNLPASVMTIPSGWTDPQSSHHVPAMGETWIERITEEPSLMGGTSKRLSNEHHQYATKATFSKDKKHIRTEDKLIRVSDGAIVKDSLPFNSESHWSHVDNNVLLGCSGNVFRKWNWVTDEVTDIVTVSGANSLKIGGGEGGLSKEDTRVMVTERAKMWSLDLINGVVLGSQSLSGLDAGSVTPSGDYIVAHNDDYWCVYNAADFSFIGKVGKGRHCDVSQDVNGDDCICTYGQRDGAGSDSTYFGCACFIRLNDLAMFVIGQRGDYGEHIYSSAHVSGRCFDLPGWCHYSSGNNGTKAFPKRTLMSLVKLAPTTKRLEGPSERYPGGVYAGAVEFKPLAWNRSTSESGTSQYRQQPKPAISFDGSAVCFNSHWYGSLGTGHTLICTQYG